METRKKRSVIWQVDREKFQEIVKQNDSLSGILKYFDMCIGRGNYSTLKRRLIQDKIDYSHIKMGLQANKDRKFITNVAFPLEQVMVEDSTYCRGALKRRLLENGMMKNECSMCGQKGEWNGKSLIMVLDHINGIGNDHRFENLRMVCPNCNSQLETTAGKSRRKINNCKKCGRVVGRKSEYCKKCSGTLFNIKKIKNRPSKEELEKMISEMPMTKIGEKYGVSSNAVKKWCKGYGMQLKNRQGYWTKIKYGK